MAKESKTGYRRSIYLMQRRSTAVTMLDTFDAPQLRPNCPGAEPIHRLLAALQLRTARRSGQFPLHAGRVIDAVDEDPEAQVERSLSNRSGPSTVGQGNWTGANRRWRK